MPIAVVSCSEDAEVANGEVKNVTVTISQFENGDVGTRTNYSIGQNGFEGVWADGDVLGIYPVGGDQVAFPISDGVGTSTAFFDGGAWALRSTFTYASYYPFSEENYILPMTAIPVSYEGQVQTGNDSYAHFSKFDFMAAAPIAPSSNGGVNLLMKHLGAYLHIQLTMPNAATFTNLQIEVKSGTGSFITNGTVNLNSANPAVTASAGGTSSSVSLGLNGISTSASNQMIKLYMLVAPTSLASATLKFIVTDTAGSTYSVETTGKNFTANMNYLFPLVLSKDGTGGEIENPGGWG